MPDKKWILERWADAFDKMHRENMDFIQEGTDMHIKEVAEKYGESSWQVQFAKGHGKFTYAFLEGSGLVAQSFLDILRLGETIRKPSIGAVVSDGLRLVSIAGVASRAIKFISLKAAFRVPGGNYSCTATGATMGLRMSGVKMFARINNILEAEIGTIFSESLILSENFQGMWIKPWLESLRRLGLKINEVSNVKNVAEIESLVKKTGKSILFNAEGNAAPKHTMLVYRDLRGAVRVADQAEKAHEASSYLQRYNTLYEIYQLENAAILHPYVGISGAAAIGLQAAARYPFWADLIGVPIIVVDHAFMNSVESKVREELKQHNPPTVHPVKIKQTVGTKPKIISTAGLKKQTTVTQVNSDTLPVQSTFYAYKVITGDTLFGLAKRFYGDAAKYIWIQEKNKGVLPPIQPHQQLPVSSELIIPSG